LLRSVSSHATANNNIIHRFSLVKNRRADCHHPKILFFSSVCFLFFFGLLSSYFVCVR
jgi:hypothetical protein